MIRWIDLSFNNIRVFGDCFKCIRRCKLNLQANRISDLKQVKRLGELPKLKKLSLFGNPIEEKKHYRSLRDHGLSPGRAVGFLRRDQ